MLEKLFEGFLWRSRWVVIIAVIASLLTGFAVFYIATVDAWMLLTHLGDYLDPLLSGEARADFRATQIAHVVEIIDGYLLATVLLIFSLGLYELFISRIDEAEGSDSSSRVLIIHSLDELKSRLAKVVLMILIVKFFEHALHMEFETPLDILAFAGGIALIGLALFLSHAGDHKPANNTSDSH
ncbi:YqhA family protein [Granulosicoccaceae sp. 1_MG-2023]|nr:YqhA family protein [Granulosicoccaceae sp. 1_MG-2023]